MGEEIREMPRSVRVNEVGVLKPEGHICWVLNYRVKKDVSGKTLARLMDLLEATVPAEKLAATKSLGKSILRDLEGRIDEVTRDTITFERQYMEGMISLD